MKRCFSSQKLNFSTVAGALGVGILVAAQGGCASSAPPSGSVDAGRSAAPVKAAEPATDNAELALIYKADQADRLPGTAPADWHDMEKNDLARQARVRELLDSGAVKTGKDYYHAAMVYQHAEGADGVQVAHELAMIGACLGDKNSRWLAAASYDRMLMNLDRPQRFGTQYRSDENGVMKLYRCSEGVSDAMRSALNVPSLAKAKEREKEMQKQMDDLNAALKREGAGHEGAGHEGAKK